MQPITLSTKIWVWCNIKQKLISNNKSNNKAAKVSNPKDKKQFDKAIEARKKSGRYYVPLQDFKPESLNLSNSRPLK